MPKAYLGLGSNVGDRKAYLRAAVKILETHKDIHVKEVSGIYETQPEGYTSQRRFFNAAVGLETRLSPIELLRVCQFIEQFLKRKRLKKWGPRNIDVDILLYDSRQVNQAELVIPHPEMKKRAFVLIPLLEIAPQVIFPSGIPVRSCLESLGALNVVRVGNLNN